MRRNILLSFVALPLIAGVVLIAYDRSPAGVANAAATGPTISLGTPSFSSGTVQIPVLTSGSGFAGYSGFNLHMRWNPASFHFASATIAGGLLAGGAFCPPADPNTFDSDGGGVVYSCTTLGSTLTTTGQLAVISITPLGTGCSNVHLFTFGPPDGGDSNSGTYTVNAVDFSAQANAYGPDIGVDQTGASCVPAGSPTATFTPTLTPTPTNTATATASPTITPTPAVGAPDVTVSASAIPAQVDSDGTLTYSANVSNIGGATATGVQLDFNLPVGAVPLKTVYCKIWVVWRFSCKLPDLPPGGNVPVTLTVQAPIITASLLMQVDVHVSAVNEPLANTGNNDALVSTNVTGCPDLNGDGVINILDFAVAAQSFGLHIGQPGYNPLADLNGDGMITIADLGIMSSRYGNHCTGLDSDHDGLSDFNEINVYHTNPFNPDTEGDGLPDGVEVFTYGSNPSIPDPRSDGYSDAEKAALGTDPTAYCLIMAADLNKDHVVNILDLAVAAQSYHLHTGQPGFNPRADINGDGVVNILDFAFLAQVYQQNVTSCP